MDGDREQLLDVVEQMAMVMDEAGMPRMAARVYSFVLADDADRYTAKELADGLGVSLAAISGAVKYLVQAGMIGKVRRPGDRADSYVIDDDDLWTPVLTGRNLALERLRQAIVAGAETLGDTRGGRRLRESALFFDFLEHDLEGMIERWEAYRKDLLQRSASSDTGRSTQSAT